jgi:hypothetical protein
MASGKQKQRAAAVLLGTRGVERVREGTEELT